MAIAVTMRGTPLHDTANTTAYTMVDAGTPTTNVFLLAAIYARGATPTFSSFTGYGLTWTAIFSVLHATAHHSLFYGAISTGADSTDPVATWTTARSHASIQMMEVTGVNTGAAILGGIVRDQGGASYGEGATAGASSISDTLIAPADANSRYVSLFTHDANEATTTEANWALLDDGGGATPAHRSAVAWSNLAGADNSVTASWAGGTRSNLIALELIAYTPPAGGIRTLGTLGVGK